MFTVLICGGRDFGNIKEERDFILGTLEQLAIKEWPRLEEDEYGNWLPDVRVVSGGAKGVDSVAIDWAVVNWLSFKEYKADWEKYGKGAGTIRNKQMLDEEDVNVVVAFPGGRGTANMIKQAKERGIEVKEIR